MNKRLFSIVAAGLMLAADDTKKEYDRFEGTWKFISVEQDGMKLPVQAIEGSRLICKGDIFTVTDPALTYKGTFKLDATKKPKTIDATFTEGPEKGTTMLGIYELEGDVYKVCFNVTGKDRPTEFAGKKGSGHVFQILRRDKK
jgi:uncharacterized protein (TIGR03067 family)